MVEEKDTLIDILDTSDPAREWERVEAEAAQKAKEDAEEEERLAADAAKAAEVEAEEEERLAKERVCCDKCDCEGCGELHFEMSIDGNVYVLKEHMAEEIDDETSQISLNYNEPCDCDCDCVSNERYSYHKATIESSLRSKVDHPDYPYVVN